MTAFGDYPEIAIDIDDWIATVEIRRPPLNFFHVGLIGALADAFEALDREPSCRAIILCSEGKVFCAGAELSAGSDDASPTAGPRGGGHLYEEAVRLFRTRTPVVAAVQGAAVGGGGFGVGAGPAPGFEAGLVSMVEEALTVGSTCRTGTVVASTKGAGLGATLDVGGALTGPASASAGGANVGDGSAPVQAVNSATNTATVKIKTRHFTPMLLPRGGSRVRLGQNL